MDTLGRAKCTMNSIFCTDQPGRNRMYQSKRVTTYCSYCPNIYSVYEGHFANGLRHGHGILRLANRNYIYDGGWAQDKMHGFGKLKMGSGVHYEGYFDNNQFHGQVGFKISF